MNAPARVLAPTERQVQRAILQMCGALFPDVYIHHSPNGTKLPGSQRDRQVAGGILRGDGMKAGFPDLIFMWEPAKVGFMEVKRPKTGKLSPEQVTVLQKLYDLGFPFAVVNSVDAAYEILLEWGAPCRGQLVAA